MKKFKGYINHSNLGNTVSLFPRSYANKDFCESITVYIPDEFNIAFSAADEPLIEMPNSAISNPWVLLNNIIGIDKENKIYICDERCAPCSYKRIYLPYDNLGWGDMH